MKKIIILLLITVFQFQSLIAEELNFEIYQTGQNEIYREKLSNFLTNIKVAASPELVDIFINKADKHMINPLTLAAVSAVSRGISGGSGKIPFFGMVPLEPKFALFISEFYGVSFNPEVDLGNFNKNIELSAAAFGFFSEVYQSNQSAAVLTLFYDPDVIADAVAAGQFSETQIKILTAVHNLYQQIHDSKEVSATEPLVPLSPSLEPASTIKLPDPESEPVKTTEVTKLESLHAEDTAEKVSLYTRLKNPRGIELSKQEQEEISKLIVDVTEKTKLPPELRNDYAKLIIEQSSKNRINPLMLAALIMNESSFKEGIISKEGKLGLMQLDPAEGEYYSQLISIPWNQEQALQAQYNISFGSGIFKLALDIFDNDPQKAIAGYNYGIKKFIQALKEKEDIPESTLKLPTKVISLQNKWLEIINPANFVEVVSPTIIPSPISTIAEALSSPTLEVPAINPSNSPLPITSPSPSATIASVISSSTPVVASPSPSPSPTPVVPSPTPTASPKPAVSPSASPSPAVKYDSPEKLVQAVTCESMQNKKQCRMISEQLILFSNSNEIDLLLLTALAKNLSNFQIGLQQSKADRYGLFQFKNKEMKQITYRAKVVWGGINELLELNYSLRLACKYLTYLQNRYPKNMEAVISGFVSSPENYNKKRVKESEKSIIQKTLKDINNWKKSLR